MRSPSWPRCTTPRCPSRPSRPSPTGSSDWQNRPLDVIYPLIFIDVINVKIREGNVANRPIYVALGVTVEGTRDILGLVGRRARRRGRRQVLAAGAVGDQESGHGRRVHAVCDGLKGLPEAIETVWPKALTSSCRGSRCLGHGVGSRRSAMAATSRFRSWAEVMARALAVTTMSMPAHSCGCGSWWRMTRPASVASTG